MPLAIELAAGRIDSLGLQGLADRLDEMFALLTRGRISALPRHRTLQALLDWSHDLLTEVERVVLRRLSIFPAGFTLEAACAVLAGDDLPAASVVDGVMGLAAKSLVAVDISGETVLHRLLYTTRTYAADKLARSGEDVRLAAAHAAHFEAVLARATPARARSVAEWLHRYGRLMDDVRAGLDWAFSPGGDTLLGVRLTTAALDLVYELGLLDEYRSRVDVAMEVVGALQPPQPGLELRLRAARSFLHAQTKGRHFSRDVQTSRASSNSPISWARAPQRFEAMFSLCANAFGVGEYREVAEVARRIKNYAPDPDEPVAVLLSDRFLALSHHYLGEHDVGPSRSPTESFTIHPGQRAHRQYASATFPRLCPCAF